MCLQATRLYEPATTDRQCVARGGSAGPDRPFVARGGSAAGLVSVSPPQRSERGNEAEKRGLKRCPGC